MEYVKIQIDVKVMREIERLAKSRGLELQDGIDRFMSLGANRLKSLREHGKKKAEEAGRPTPRPRKIGVFPKNEKKEEAEPKPKRAKKKAEPSEATTEGRVKRPKPLKPRKKKAKAEEPEADPMAPILEES